MTTLKGMKILTYIKDSVEKILY